MTPLFEWNVKAQAEDETDAAIVAEVLAGAIRDERNDPAEPVDVSFHPIDDDDGRRSYIHRAIE